MLQSLRDYFRALDRGKLKHDQVKLLLVGNGRVGKTSIVNRLIDNRFDESEESTHGIQLREWYLDGVARDKLEEQPVTVNIWDFAGQDIYHSTHRLFMRTRALFLLVWDKETENTEHRIDTETQTRYENFDLTYWIEYIKTLSGSPVIIVQNKIDGGDEKDVSYALKVQEHYPPPSGIIDYCFESAKNSSENGIASLKDSIRSALNQFGTIGHELPHQWIQVREHLSGLAARIRHLTYRDYEQICHDVGLKESEPQTLANFLHQTGSIFYRSEDFDGAIILDQKWAIDGVYSLLDHRNVQCRYLRNFAEKGLTLEQISEAAWESHTEQECKLLIDFMKSCELCFEYREGIYYIPQLLSGKKPGGIADRWLDSTVYSMKVDYNFLHRAIIERFFVRIGRHVQDRYPGIWKNGVVIYDKQIETEALVEAFPKERQISVQAKGQDPVSMLNMIRNELTELHSEFSPKVILSVDGGKSFVTETALHQFTGASARKIPSSSGGFVDIAPFQVFLENSDARLARGQLKPAVVVQDQIFLSYAWNDLNEERDNERIVDQLYEALTSKGFKIVRDKKDMGYKDIISDFMRNIGKGKIVIIVLSEKYLKSAYCMYELMEIYKFGNIHNRVFPIILDSAKLHSLGDRLEYVAYWKNEKKKIERLIDSIGIEAFSSSGTFREYDLYYRQIFSNIDEILSILSDWNTLTPRLLAEDNFARLLMEIEERVHERTH